MKTDKKRIVFVVNPISGTSRKKDFDGVVAKELNTDLFQYEIVRTERAGHASEIAAHCAAKHIDICVAVGGDGTVNEVAGALVGTDTALGIVPSGSGNGLARHLSIPINIKRALRTINSGTIDSFDYGIINGHPFFCTCGMGFDAHVSKLFSQSDKRGLTTYARMVLSEGLKYQPQSYEVSVADGEGSTTHYEAFLIACANAAQYGNNTYIAPGASMQDGLLDVIIINPFKKTGGPKVLLDLFTRSIKKNPHVVHFQTRHIHIHRQTEDTVHYDGDSTAMGTDIDIEIVPRGFKAIVSQKHLLY